MRHGNFLSTPAHEDKAVYMKHGKTVEPRIRRPVSHRFRSGLLYLWHSLVTGIAEVISFAHPARRITFPHTDVSSALRDDWVRIGLDMGSVLKRKQEALHDAVLPTTRVHLTSGRYNHPVNRKAARSAIFW